MTCTRAFGADHRVLRINGNIDWDHDWPDPYIVSKSVRCIACTMKMVSVKVAKAVSALNRVALRTIFWSSQAQRGNSQRDVESSGEASLSETGISQEERAKHVKDRYLRSLKTVFGEADSLRGIMEDIERWEKGR